MKLIKKLSEISKLLLIVSSCLLVNKVYGGTDKKYIVNVLAAQIQEKFNFLVDSELVECQIDIDRSLTSSTSSVFKATSYKDNFQLYNSSAELDTKPSFKSKDEIGNDIYSFTEFLNNQQKLTIKITVPKSSVVFYALAGNESDKTVYSWVPGSSLPTCNVKSVESQSLKKIITTKCNLANQDCESTVNIWITTADHDQLPEDIKKLIVNQLTSCNICLFSNSDETTATFEINLKNRDDNQLYFRTIAHDKGARTQSTK